MRPEAAWRSFAGLGAVAALAASLAVDAAEPAPKLPPAWSSGPWKPAAVAYGVGMQFDVPVRMSDGVTLRASIAYPTDPATGKRAKGPFPVLLEQTPYSDPPAQQGASTDALRMLTQYFVTRGYMYVSAEVRGTHHSEGEFSLISQREQQDGVELVAWVARELEGSNGKVGLTGCSYTGLNQYFTAALVGKNSPVKAMAPTGVGPDWYREPGMIGGVPTTSLQKAFLDVWAATGTYSAVKFNLAAVADIRSGGDSAYDRAFWQTRSATSVIPRIVENGIPALMFADWNDYPTSPSEAYVMFQNVASGRDLWAPMSADQRVSTRYQLIVGDEQHCAGRAGGRMDEALLKWFDTWLKGADTGILKADTTIHLRELGSARWVDGRSYPQVERYQSYYLRSDGALSGAKPDESNASDRMTYAHPSRPGATLTYTTQPFPQGAMLAGPVATTVYARSTAANILLIADLFDVAPDGTATQLSTGALIGSLRKLDEGKSWRDKAGRLIRPYHVFSTDEALTPGVVNAFDIQLQPRQAALASGHSLRLTLKSQSDPAPCGELFPGKRAFWCLDPTVPQRQALEGAAFEIQRSAQWPSHINLPLLPLPAGL